MTKRKTCFVISPIGAEGSDIRQRANDFLELLVEPALQRFNFDVIRADKIQQPTAITGDIIRLVQESDICLIDLTDYNPNVFYECGRRHETGKPFIQLVEKGSLGSLPFDVSGIRTLAYDLSTPRDVLKSVQELQSYIQIFVDAGLDSGNTGETLSSLAQGIERLERKINLMMSGPSSSIMGPSVGPKANIEDLVLPPQQSFQNALAAGDIDRAYSAAQRFGPKRDRAEYAAMMAVLAAAGYEKAYQVLDNLIREESAKKTVEEISETLFQVAITGLKRYFESSGEFEQGAKYLRDTITRFQAMDGDIQPSTAFLYNQLGMLYWSNNQFTECAEATSRAVDLLPNEGSYVYNVALAYEYLEDEERLIPALKKLKNLKSEDQDHLELIRRHGV